MAWLKRRLASFLASVSVVALPLTALCGMCCAVCAVVAIVVGAWDGLAWLVKADWRTTDFVVPIIAGPAAVVFGILGRGFMELSDSAASWAKRLVPGSAPQ